MKMIKSVFVIALMALMLAIPALAAVNFNSPNINTTLRFPVADMYRTNNDGLVLNVTVNRTSSMNITNVSFIFTLGTTITYFTNSTINGSKPVQNSESHFEANVTNLGLAEGIWNLTVEVRNATEVSNPGTSINTSSVLFGIDRSGAAVVISEPYAGSTVVPNNNLITFNYLPTESNLGNCSLNLNNQLVKSSASGSIFPNVSSGVNNRFTHGFGAENLSVRLAIRCIDLAGVGSSSSAQNNFTFNVLVGAISPAIRQAQIAAAGGGGFVQAPQQPAFSAASQSAAIQQASTHLQKWVWAYIIGIVAVAGLAVRKYYK